MTRRKTTVAEQAPSSFQSAGKYDNIFLAHAQCREAVLIHGSSGFGKSYIVKDFAKRHGFAVVEKRTCYVDPMAVVLPHKDMDRGCVTFMPADWLHEIMTTTKPTILFLDEFNRPASPQTFSLFTELLLDRSVDGLKISDSVLIVGACNLGEEDTGVVDIPNAVVNRLTHIVHAPGTEECCARLTSDLMRKVVPSVAKSLLKTAAIPEITPDACPRQIDACGRLADTELLTDAELAMVCRGRVGQEKGTILAEAIRLYRQNAKRKMPDFLTKEAMPILAKVEADGEKLEVISFLLAEKEARASLVAEYLVKHATPETCRSLAEHKFDQEITVDGVTMDWRGFALRAGKLAAKRA